MRLCTIMSGGKPAVGVKMGNGKIVDLSKQMPRGITAARSGAGFVERARALIAARR